MDAKHKIEMIEWADHCSLSNNDRGWRPWSEIENMEVVPIFSVGWVVKETDQYVIMVSHLGDDNDVYGEMLIIKTCITRRLMLLDDNNDRRNRPDGEVALSRA